MASMQDESALVSIVTPVYNTPAHLLKACMRSVLAQTYVDFEWILADDGSSQETHDVLRCIAAGDARVRVLEQSHGGVSAARNAGIEAAHGAFVTFIDADDRVYPTFLQEAIAALGATGADIAIGLLEIVGEDYHVRPAGALDGGVTAVGGEDLAAFRRFLVSGRPLTGRAYGGIRPLPVAPRVYRASVLRDVRFNSQMAIAEDGLFGAEAAHVAQRVCLVDSLWYTYVRNEQSATGANSVRRLHEHVLGFAHYADAARERGWDESDVGMRYCSVVRTELIGLSHGVSFAELVRQARWCVRGPVAGLLAAVEPDTYELSSKVRLMVRFMRAGTALPLALLVRAKARTER